ncbi:MAG TPA: type II toxin-antitoxin system Phd/YefM family antitoxin [Terracidiphilus sp.]|jgi:prevent-host-death family protein|nr:type II toxin-antitoxin system Phd/YefM family antitoxin [Terracidiphilus sp.]
MATTTFSSREFNQDTSRAKKAAEKGPVIITDRGRPSHVLLSIHEFRKLTSKRPSIGEMIAMDNADSVEFEPPRIGDEFPVSADLG